MKPEDKEYWTEVGQRVKKLRKKQGLTQAKLVEKIVKSSDNDGGFASSTLSLLESGDRRPRSRTVKRIAEALGVPPGEICPPRKFTWERPAEATLSDIRETLKRYPPLKQSNRTIDCLVELIELYGFAADKGRRKEP